MKKLTAEEWEDALKRRDYSAIIEHMTALEIEIAEAAIKTVADAARAAAKGTK